MGKETVNRICIYHSRDLDGWMSAAIVKLKFPDIKLMGWDYGDEFLNIPEGVCIIMVDVSFPMEIMLEVVKKAKWDLLWIDHHISAINEFEKFINGGETFCRSILDTNFAACELTWQFFFPDTEMPEIIRLLGRYDCFGHKGTNEEQKVLEFQYGARQAISNADEAYQTLIIARGRGDWSFDKDLCDDILLQGRAIYKYLCNEAQHSYKKIFSIELDGYKFACVNQERFNPINFGIDYHKDGYDGFACFWYQNGGWTYSLYNDNGNVDCSVIAKNRGGGGHKGASGFRSKDII